MKKTAFQLVSIVVLTVSFAVVSANAQLNDGYRAHIPFDFMIGKASFKAGDYAIGWSSPNGYANVIKIVNANNRNTNFFMANPAVSDPKRLGASLVFNRYQDKYVLVEMVSPNLSAKFLMRKSEQQLAKEGTPQLETVRMVGKR